jgi:hypothetical protein
MTLPELAHIITPAVFARIGNATSLAEAEAIIDGSVQPSSLGLMRLQLACNAADLVLRQNHQNNDAVKSFFETPIKGFGPNSPLQLISEAVSPAEADEILRMAKQYRPALQPRLVR